MVINRSIIGHDRVCQFEMIRAKVLHVLSGLWYGDTPEVILEAAGGGREDVLVDLQAVVTTVLVEAALKAANGLDEGLCPRADALGDLGQAAVDELDRVFGAVATAVVVIVDLLQR